MPIHPKGIAYTDEGSLISSLNKEGLQAISAKLNAEIIAFHEAGKHEEGDALRSQHLHVLDCLRGQ